MSIEITHQDGIVLLHQFAPQSVQLIATDPPFGTERTRTLASSPRSYEDLSVIQVRELCSKLAAAAAAVLRPEGVLAVLLDHRAVHAAHNAAQAFLEPLGEIVWHFETGGVSKSWWSNKHNTILLFGPRGGTPKFNYDAVPTVARKAPKAGYTAPKKVSSVWNINMSTTDPQRVGYPTQKPEELFRRLVAVHTDEGDTIVDPFAGSGTLGAVSEGRRCILTDESPTAIQVMEERFSKCQSMK